LFLTVGGIELNSAGVKLKSGGIGAPLGRVGVARRTSKALWAQNGEKGKTLFQSLN